MRAQGGGHFNDGQSMVYFHYPVSLDGHDSPEYFRGFRRLHADQTHVDPPRPRRTVIARGPIG